MNEIQKYRLWLEKAVDDPDIAAELKSIEENAPEISDRFYRELEFGTGGLRGVLGAGDNRMNVYTVRKASQGLADYLNANFKTPSAAISFDSRIKSKLFAKETARVLAANGIKAYIYPELMPTPMLSFAVRELGCSAGVMITASHNPAKYNGYKVYGPDGCQLIDAHAAAVLSYIKKVDIFSGVKLCDYGDGLRNNTICIIGSDICEKYFAEVLSRQVNPGICADVGLKVVYTPLNGAGNKPVREILKRIGISNVAVVPEQELPDGNFPTAPYPNPEIRQAFERAIALAQKVRPDILLATDPDCDRMGIAVRDGEGYSLMSGNEVGCLLLDYILSCGKASGTLPEHPVVIKTIVTSDLARGICKKYGCELREVLTGFKYIGEQIGLLEKDGHAERFVFGFEESYGYLSGSYVRDKDGVVAAMLTCEMAAYYKKRGLSLPEVLDGLYREHGVFRHSLLTREFDGEEGMRTMKRITATLRQSPPKEIDGMPVISITDCLASRRIDLVSGEKSVLSLPKSDVLSFGLPGDSGVVIRPSGTEPKIKLYITATGETPEKADRTRARLEKAALELLN